MDISTGPRPRKGKPMADRESLKDYTRRRLDQFRGDHGFIKECELIEVEEKAFARGVAQEKKRIVEMLRKYIPDVLLTAKDDHFQDYIARKRGHSLRVYIADLIADRIERGNDERA